MGGVFFPVSVKFGWVTVLVVCIYLLLVSFNFHSYQIWFPFSFQRKLPKDLPKIKIRHQSIYNPIAKSVIL